MMYSINDIAWRLPHSVHYKVVVLADDVVDFVNLGPMEWGEMLDLLDDDYWSNQVELENTTYFEKGNVMTLFFKRRGHAETEE